MSVRFFMLALKPSEPALIKKQNQSVHGSARKNEIADVFPTELKRTHAVLSLSKTNLAKMLVRLFNFMSTVLRVCTCVYSVTKKKKNCFLISVYYQQMMHAMDSRCIKFPDITSPRSDSHIDDTFLSRKFRNPILQGTRFT